MILVLQLVLISPVGPIIIGSSFAWPIGAGSDRSGCHARTTSLSQPFTRNKAQVSIATPAMDTGQDFRCNDLCPETCDYIDMSVADRWSRLYLVNWPLVTTCPTLSRRIYIWPCGWSAAAISRLTFKLTLRSRPLMGGNLKVNAEASRGPSISTEVKTIDQLWSVLALIISSLDGVVSRLYADHGQVRQNGGPSRHTPHLVNSKSSLFKLLCVCQSHPCYSMATYSNICPHMSMLSQRESLN